MSQAEAATRIVKGRFFLIESTGIRYDGPAMLGGLQGFWEREIG
jgi:hypothetical protein